MVSLVSVNIHVERPPGVLLCQVFGDMQSWLNTNKIEPLNYHLTGGGWTAGVRCLFQHL